MDRMDWINLAYLVAGLGFVFSLKWMTAAATARRGVLAGEVGFGIAIVATLFWPGITTEGYILIAVAALIGSTIGVPLGLMVPMTAMPQRIAL
jgi:NAD(P) transhydrogenase subunit beta